MRTFLILTLLIMALGAGPARADDAAKISLMRLECGLMQIEDISFFADSFEYDGQSGDAVNGCYLVRHRSASGDRYLLWDAGLRADIAGAPYRTDDGWNFSLERTLEDQLAEIGLAPADIDFLGVSHFHGDHIGQAGLFTEATLLIGQRDIDFLESRPVGNARTKMAHWFGGEGKRTGVTADHDVFGDGSATVLALPGHTDGHLGLLVRLEGAGPVLLSGDLYHYAHEMGRGVVSNWNSSRAETLASQARFEQIIKALDPIVIIQHDRADIGKLPPFPEYLE